MTAKAPESYLFSGERRVQPQASLIRRVRPDWEATGKFHLQPSLVSDFTQASRGRTEGRKRPRTLAKVCSMCSIKQFFLKMPLPETLLPPLWCLLSPLFKLVIPSEIRRNASAFVLGIRNLRHLGVSSLWLTLAVWIL